MSATSCPSTVTMNRLPTRMFSSPRFARESHFSMAGLPEIVVAFS